MRYKQYKNSDKSNFSEKLDYIISKSGLSQKDVADRIGVRETSLSHARTGPKSGQMNASINLLYELVSGSHENLYADCLNHLKAYMDEHRGDQAMLGWTLIELKNRFPVSLNKQVQDALSDADTSFEHQHEAD